jgi:hypothetical protein
VGHVLNGSLTKKFEGATNYVSVPTGVNLIATGALTISMWVNPSDEHSTRTAIFGHYNHTPPQKGVVVWDHNNKIGFGLRKDAPDAWSVRQTTSAAVTVGSWCHIAAVFEPSQTPLIYIDGVLAATKPLWGGANIPSITDPEEIATIGGGEAFNSVPQYFQGNIANVAYYVGTGLSSSEIVAQYEVGCPADLSESTLHGYWPLDGNLTDISAGGNSIGDGTEVGSVPDEIDITRPVAQIKQEELDISAVSATNALYYTLWQDPVHETQYNYGARLDEITLHYTIPSQIGNLAKEIASGYFFYLTGTELTTQISDTSGWLTVNMGQLNALIYTSYSGVDPNMGLEEASIYTQLYLQSYYISRAKKVLRNIGNDADWIRIVEGDTTLVRTNKNEVSKAYRGLAKDAQEMTNSLVASYHQYLAQPTQVAGTDASTGVLVYPT